MKRSLFYCGAAVALVVASAAQAAEPVKLTIGGYMNEWAGYASNQSGKDFAGTNAFGGNYPTYNGASPSALKAASFDTQSDVELDFKGSTKLDNGITVGVEVDTAPSQGVNTRTVNAQNKDTKRSFATVSSGFGTVEVGQQDNVGALIHNSAPDLTGIGGQDNNWVNWVLQPTGHRGLGRTYAGDDRVDDKVIYVTPSYHGLAAGVSYTPSINTAGAGATMMPSSNDAPVVLPNGTVAVGGDLYVYGLAYNDTFGGVGVKADVGSGQDNVGGLTVYQSGLQVSYAGFTVGGSFLQRNVRNSSAVYKDALAQGNAWDAGVSYGVGPYSVALNYFAEQAAKGNTTDANSMAGNGGILAAVGSTSYGYDRDHVVAVEGKYDLGPGVAVNLTAFDVKYTDANGVAAESNQGWGVLSGLAVKF